MSLSIRHFHDYVEPTNNHRLRLYLTFAGVSEIPISATTIPEWGGGVSLGWYPLPDDCVSTPQLGETAFASSFCVGAPNAPTAKVQFELVRLGILGFDDVVAALLSPTVAGGVSYAIPGGSSHTMTTGTTTLLTILSDNGNEALGVEEFAVVFQGAQVAQSQRPLKPSYVNDACFYEATFSHIVEACLERIKPIDISQYALYNLNAEIWVNPAGGSGDYAFAHLYDAIYQDSGGDGTYAIGSATRAADIGDQFRCRLFAVESLSYTLEVLAEEVYKSLTRDDTATFDFRVSLGTNASSGNGTPFDFLRFATRTYDTTGARGSTTLIVNNSGTKQLYFVGAGWQGGNTTYTIDSDELGVALDDGEIVFGMYSPNDTDAGVYKYSNAYDLFVDMCAGGICKASYQFEDDLSCDIYFSPVLGGIRAIQPVHRTDVVGAPDVVLGAGFVASVEAQWPDPQGDDEGVVVRAATIGNLGDNKGGVNLFFHNLPYQGSESDFKWWNGNAVGYPNIAQTDNVFMSYPYFSPRRLYYFDNAGTLLSGDSPILVHNQVQIQKNWSTFTDWIGTSQSWSVPELRSGVSLPFSQSYQDYYTEQFVRPYRARALSLQRESCLAYAASDWLQSTFGSEDQWGLSIKVDADKANVSYIGERFQLQDESNNVAALDIFLQNGSFLDASHYPSLAYCVSASEEDGFMQLSLLGIAAT